MIGHRAIAGLLLLAALVFCAAAAPGASAKGTTAFTCVSGGGAKDFSDAHCDTPSGSGGFGHVSISEGVETNLTVTNEKTANSTTQSTPAILKGEVALIKTEITCTTVGNGTLPPTLWNKEILGTMQTESKRVELLYSGCTINKPAKCVLAKPTIELKATAITRENLFPFNEMGVEFKPAFGSFASITFSGAECPLKGFTFSVNGTAIGTGGRGSAEGVTSSGSTLVFTNAMTKETLTLGGKPAEFSNTVTVKMEGGNPITLTTTVS